MGNPHGGLAQDQFQLCVLALRTGFAHVGEGLQIHWNVFSIHMINDGIWVQLDEDEGIVAATAAGM
jgi:hypothetical protein